MKNNKSNFESQFQSFYSENHDFHVNQDYKILGFPFKSGVKGDSISQIEFGLESLFKNGDLKNFKLIFNFEEKCTDFGVFKKDVLENIENYNPDMIFFENFQEIKSKPDPKILDYLASLKIPLVYFEWNPWSMFRKRPTIFLRQFFEIIDINFIKGSGTLFNVFEALGGRNISFTVHPSNQNLMNFDLTSNKKLFEISMFCNYWPSKLNILNMDGVNKRYEIVSELKNFYGDKFKLFGKNWDQKFQSQVINYSEVPEYQFYSKINLGWEHYSKIPYYFSNRLPNSYHLGVPYFSNPIIGLESILPNYDFLTYKNTNGLIEKINTLMSDSNLYENISTTNKKFAYDYFDIKRIFKFNINQIEAMYF